MIVTTTPTIEGYRITNYIRVIGSETISGVNAIKDFAAGLRDIVGGRSGSYEKELIKAREQALAELVDRAMQLGANAIVGVELDFMSAGQSGSMLCALATGTAVTVEPCE